MTTRTKKTMERGMGMATRTDLRLPSQESAQQVHGQDLKRPKKQTAAEPKIKVLNYKILSHHRRLTDQSIQTEIAAGTDGRLVKDAALVGKSEFIPATVLVGKNAKNNQRMYKSMKAKRQVCSLSKCRIFTVTSHQYRISRPLPLLPSLRQGTRPLASGPVDPSQSSWLPFQALQLR